MSHFSQIKTKMVDREFVIKALEDMGLSYQEGEQEVMGFMHQKTPVDIRIALPLSYDIGLRKHAGGYEIVADWFGVRGVNQKDFTERLNQRYAYHTARAKLEQQGFTMAEEKVEQTGEIRIVLRRMA